KISVSKTPINSHLLNFTFGLTFSSFLSKDDIIYIPDKAEEFEDVARGKRKCNILEGKILAYSSLGVLFKRFFMASSRGKFSYKTL
ncbi:MAG TPA: hypothetical protein EYP08_08800, partial [Pyrodictiaceae archaeon]|nr:hypothetical protein [Pyrodictiaceae archaeon]